MAFGFLSLFLSNLIMLLAPQVLRQTVDALRVSPETTNLSLYALAFFGVVVLQGVFRYYVRQTLGVVSRRVEYDMRNDLFSHIQKLTPSFFHTMKTGDIMSRCTNDMQAVRMLLGPGIMYSGNAIVVFIAVVITLLVMNPTLTMYALIPMLILPLSSNRLSKRLYTRSRQVQEQIAEISGLAQESIAGVRVVKAYGREERLIEKFERASQDYVRHSMDLIKIQGTIWPLMGTIAGMSSVIVIWFGGILVIENTISLGELVAFETYLAFLMWPLMAFGWVINVIQRGMASMHRMNELLDSEPEDSVVSGESADPVAEGSVTFSNLSFSYGDQTVLHDISFELEAGRTLAIIGPTGSGKSTLINLISRMYDPPPGTIFIDGRDVCSMPLKTLRAAIGMVPQETLLFSRTIGENIAYGNPDASDEEIRAASEVSQIRSEIEDFPNGFDTMVGERGVTLSGGQKQRTAISRAVITDPRILILDDALSSVDTYTEEEILGRLKSVMNNRTCVIVSHRISTIKDADLILVLDEGRIVQTGRHDELLAQEGLYSRIHEKQLLSDAIDNLE